MTDKNTRNSDITDTNTAPLVAKPSDANQKKKEKQRRRRQKQVLKKKLRKQALPREERLKIAPKWLAEYEATIRGRNIIKAYRRHFHIEPLCALQELKILNYPLTEQQIQKFHDTERNKVIQERNRKRNRKAKLEARREEQRLKKEGFSPFDMYPDSNDRFFFIAGHTSGGAPYGLTWEEMGPEPYQSPYDDDDCEDDE